MGGWEHVVGVGGYGVPVGRRGQVRLGDGVGGLRRGYDRPVECRTDRQQARRVGVLAPATGSGACGGVTRNTGRRARGMHPCSHTLRSTVAAARCREMDGIPATRPPGKGSTAGTRDTCPSLRPRHLPMAWPHDQCRPPARLVTISERHALAARRHVHRSRRKPAAARQLYRAAPRRATHRRGSRSDTGPDPRS